jgi:hypothetical protein
METNNVNSVISFEEVRQRFSERREGKLEAYFAQTDTPAANSPVGKLMVKVLEKFPTFTFEQARTKANELQAEAARKRKYVAPAVLTEDEQVARRKVLKARFQRSKPSADAA